MMKHATWIIPRSAITVFRFLLFDFGEVSLKRHTLISRTLSRLGCPPATSSSPRPVPWEASRADLPSLRSLTRPIYSFLFSSPFL